MEDALRTPLQGVRNILRFNWPYYIVAGVFAMVSASAIRHYDGLPAQVAGAALAATLYFLGASLLASYLVYDRSGLYEWAWLRRLLGNRHAILNIHAGFDETTAGVQRAMQCAVHPFVFYDPALTTEPSLQRARNPEGKATPFHAGQLPCRPGSCDAVLLLFAAHELRQPSERDACFEDLARSLTPHGRIVVLEHLRGPWTFAVYGPGAMHFYSHAEWLRVATSAGLTVVHEETITPFAHVFVLEPSGESVGR